MKAKVNLQLLNTKAFDSGSLGMMAMVIHQFPFDGHYRAVIMNQGRSITEIDFSVDEKSTEMQLDIDLAIAVRNAKARPEEGRNERGKQTPRIVSPKGHVLFYVSSGIGYSAIVTNTDGKEEFDSTKLAKGDLFAISLLEPTRYSMVNSLGHGEGEIVVKMAKEIRSLETAYIDVSQKGFDPENIELTASQGLVFRISDSARILVERKEAAPRKRRKSVIRWQKPKVTKNVD